MTPWNRTDDVVALQKNTNMAQAMAAGAEPGPGAATVGDSIAAHSGQNAPTENSACNVGPHWSRHLKCLVCFGYMQQPHTLACGHTFCRM